MKKYLIILFIFSFASSFAQYNSQLLINGSQTDPVMNPVFSPDGSKIAYTKASYKGIWIYNINTNSTEQISDEDAAGFTYKWSNDSKSILSRVAKYENLKRLNAVKIFDVESNSSNQITDYRVRMPYLPEWADGDSKVLLPTKEGVESFSSGKSAVLYKSGNDINILSKYDELVSKSNSNNVQKKIQPIKDAQYINSSLSPDRTKILFEVVGGNIYVMNNDGSGLVDLGKGNRPKWSLDGSKVVYMIAEDDGNDFTASDIYLINSDGSNKINLTNTNDLIEMNPSLSPDGKTVVYDEYNDGSIYLMNIEEGR